MERYNNCRTCNIHIEESFAIDEECGVCEQDSSSEFISVYQDYIDVLERNLRQERAFIRLLKEKRSK